VARQLAGSLVDCVLGRDMCVRTQRPNLRAMRCAGTLGAAPVPVSASWNAGLSVCTITFDSELRTGLTNKTQYTVYYDGKIFANTGLGTVTATTVVLGMVEGAVTALPDKVVYSAVHQDVKGANGRVVAAFEQEIT
jgi:hypothetical protein